MITERQPDRRPANVTTQDDEIQPSPDSLSATERFLAVVEQIKSRYGIEHPIGSGQNDPDKEYQARRYIQTIAHFFQQYEEARLSLSVVAREYYDQLAQGPGVDHRSFGPHEPWGVIRRAEITDFLHVATGQGVLLDDETGDVLHTIQVDNQLRNR